MIADFAVVTAIEKPQMTLKVHACCYDMRDSIAGLGTAFAIGWIVSLSYHLERLKVRF